MLAKLNPNEGDLSVKHLGGVRRPAPSAGAFQGGVQQTTAQHQNWRVGLLASGCQWSGCAINPGTPGARAARLGLPMVADVESIIPGGANRVLQITEKEQAHRHKIESAEVLIIRLGFSGLTEIGPGGSLSGPFHK